MQVDRLSGFTVRAFRVAIAILWSMPGLAVAATGQPLGVGETRMANGAIAYVPRSAPAGARPLIVMLHGAGGYPRNFLEMMKPVADARGAILLAPRSEGQTWDVLVNAASGRDPWSGRDTSRLNEVLDDLMSRVSVDRSRLILLGFSDGASYALSLGTRSPQRFSAIVALSPGGALIPDHVDGKQRIFVAHGKSDRILPFANTSDRLVPKLRAAHANVTFRAFEGDHQIDRNVLEEALDIALAAPAS